MIDFRLQAPEEMAQERWPLEENRRDRRTAMRAIKADRRYLMSVVDELRRQGATDSDWRRLAVLLLGPEVEAPASVMAGAHD